MTEAKGQCAKSQGKYGRHDSTQSQESMKVKGDTPILFYII